MLRYRLLAWAGLKTANFCSCCLISSVFLGAERISSPPYDGKTSGSLPELEQQYLLDASDFSLPLLFLLNLVK